MAATSGGHGNADEALLDHKERMCDMHGGTEGQSS